MKNPKSKLDYSKIAEKILCTIDYDIYKEDKYQNDCTLIDEIEDILVENFGDDDDDLPE